MKHYFILFIKGMSMGIANVIPGVSGGTIALITGIYEDLINSLKSFDNKSLKLITSIDIIGFIKHTNLYFLLAVFGGSIVSVFSIASLFKYLFIHYPILNLGILFRTYYCLYLFCRETNFKVEYHYYLQLGNRNFSSHIS